MTKTLKKGFTLVELIVVIAIIAILATVSVVGYSAFIENANQSKVNQELAQAENVLRAEAVETVTVSLTGNYEEGKNPTLVMSLEGSQIKFTFTFLTSDDDKQLLVNKLIIEVGLKNEDDELSTLKGKFTFEGEELKYTIDDVSATLDVVVVTEPVVVVPEP